jgi:hypothetical protein
VVPRAGLDVVAKRKFHFHCRKLKPGSSARNIDIIQSVLSWVSEILHIYWIIAVVYLYRCFVIFFGYFF